MLHRGNKKLCIFARVAVFVLALVAVGSCSPMTLEPVSSETSVDEWLTERLKSAKIPIESVSIVSKSPLSVEVRLTRQSGSEALSVDDLWARAVAARELTLAYRYGYRIDNFTVTLVNANGSVVSRDSTFLYSTDPSQKLPPFTPVDVEAEQVKDYAAKNVDLQGMSLVKLEINPPLAQVPDGMLLDIQLRTKDAASANESVGSFVLGLETFVEGMKDSLGFKPSLIRSRVYDETEQLLMYHIWDVDTGRQTYFLGKGIESWLPRPGPTAEFFSETPATPAPGLPSTAYPPPVTPTPRPGYP